MPICETISPSMPEIQPLSGSVPAVNWPQIITPKSASRKNSKAPNLSASTASGGVSSSTQSVPVSVPIHDDIVATKIPSPPSPRWPIGKPSTAVAADAGVPGMFIRIADWQPPEIAPI